MHYFYIYTVYTYHIHLSWINWIFICSIMQHLSSQPQRWQADVSDQLALVEGQSNWVLCGAMGVGWVSVGSLCRGLCKVYIYIKNHGLPWFINVHHIYDKANQPGFHNLHSGPPNLRPQPGVGQSDLEVRHWVAKRFASWTSGDPVGQLNHSSHFSYHLTSFNRLDFLLFPFTSFHQISSPAVTSYLPGQVPGHIRSWVEAPRSPRSPSNADGVDRYIFHTFDTSSIYDLHDLHNVHDQDIHWQYGPI